MGKRGRAFERVVAKVVSALDPKSDVRRGRWVVGPDGRRELDVLAEGTVNGVQRCVLIECKDFNPKTTGPVGIGWVDALDSKRRDLSVDVAIICSNAGYTADAVRKARRVGIGLIGVMKEGDKRVRFQVEEEIYTRRIRLEGLVFSLQPEPAANLKDVPFEAITYQGAPVGSWVLRRAEVLLSRNPIVAGSFAATYAFRTPVTFELPSGSASVTGITVRLRISGGWFAHQVRLDATAAVYDWLRRRVRMAPGRGQFLIKGIDVVNGGEPIERPPDSELTAPDVRKGELWTNLLTIDGPVSREPIPPLDQLIVPEDLDPFMRNLPVEAFTSSIAP